MDIWQSIPRIISGTVMTYSFTIVIAVLIQGKGIPDPERFAVWIHLFTDNKTMLTVGKFL